MDPTLGVLFLLLLASSNNSGNNTKPTTEIPPSTTDTLLSLDLTVLAFSNNDNEIRNQIPIEGYPNFIDKTGPITRVISETLKNLSINFWDFNSSNVSFDNQNTNLSAIIDGEDYKAFLNNITVRSFGGNSSSAVNICKFSTYTKIQVPMNWQEIDLIGDIKITKDRISSKGQFQVSFSNVDFFTTQSTVSASDDLILQMTYEKMGVQLSVPAEYEFFAMDALNKLKGRLQGEILSIVTSGLKSKDEIDSSRVSLVSSCIQYRNMFSEGYYVIQRSLNTSTNSNCSQNYTIAITGLSDLQTLYLTNELGKTTFLLLTNPLDGVFEWYNCGVNSAVKHVVLRFKIKGLEIKGKVSYDKNANRWNTEQMVVNLEQVDIEKSEDNNSVVTHVKNILAKKIEEAVKESIKSSFGDL